MPSRQAKKRLKTTTVWEGLADVLPQGADPKEQITRNWRKKALPALAPGRIGFFWQVLEDHLKKTKRQQ